MDNRAPLLPDQEWELEFPDAEQYAPSFGNDLSAWPEVVAGFPEDVQESIDGLLYHLEASDEVETDLLRKIALLFRGNADGREDALRIAKWLDKMADFADFFAEGVDYLLDVAVGDEPEGEDEGGTGEGGEVTGVGAEG